MGQREGCIPWGSSAGGAAPQEMHMELSGMHFGSPPPVSCDRDEQRAHPPLLHSRVRNGTGANFPSSVSGHMETKEKQRRKMDNIGKIQQMKGQGVGKGREPGEGALAKPLQTQRQDHTWTRLLEKPAEGGREVSVARD